MKKTYEPETKRAIEQVIDVFNDYIRTSTHFELLWSDKVGYIYISIDNVQGSIGDTGCCVVNCGEELFDSIRSIITRNQRALSGPFPDSAQISTVSKIGQACRLARQR